MLQNCLCFAGMIAIPLAVEVFLAPRPCLALLWGALPLSRLSSVALARFAVHSTPQTPLRTARPETDGMANETGLGPYLPGDLILTDPRFLHTSTSNVSPMPRKTVTKRFFMEEQHEEIGFDPPPQAVKRQ
jgi:hypothetical protein